MGLSRSPLVLAFLPFALATSGCCCQVGPLALKPPAPPPVKNDNPGPGPAPPPGAGPIDGAWENVTPGFDPRSRGLKVIANNLFAVVVYDRGNKTANLVFGGTSDTQGNTTKESLDFCAAEQQQNLGKSHTLTVQVQGDQMTLTGAGINGAKVNETWKRIAPKEAQTSRFDGVWDIAGGGPLGNDRSLRLIHSNHLLAINYDRNTKLLSWMHGSSLSVLGTTYKETIEFCTPGIQQTLIGKTQTLTAQLQGNQFRLTGALTNGGPIDEMWQRAK